MTTKLHFPVTPSEFTPSKEDVANFKKESSLKVEITEEGYYETPYNVLITLGDQDNRWQREEIHIPAYTEKAAKEIAKALRAAYADPTHKAEGIAHRENYWRSSQRSTANHQSSNNDSIAERANEMERYLDGGAKVDDLFVIRFYGWTVVKVIADRQLVVVSDGDDKTKALKQARAETSGAIVAQVGGYSGRSEVVRQRKGTKRVTPAMKLAAAEKRIAELEALAGS